MLEIHKQILVDENQKGDYRIGITVSKQTQTIICRRIAHRKDIYFVYVSSK